MADPSRIRGPLIAANHLDLCSHKSRFNRRSLRSLNPLVYRALNLQSLFSKDRQFVDVRAQNSTSDGVEGFLWFQRDLDFTGCSLFCFHSKYDIFYLGLLAHPHHLVHVPSIEILTSQHQSDLFEIIQKTKWFPSLVHIARLLLASQVLYFSPTSIFFFRSYI